MTGTLLLLIALLVLPVVLLCSFAGCVGDDPQATIDQLQKDKDDANRRIVEIEKQKQEDEQKKQESAKYFNKILGASTLVSYWRLDELGTGGTSAKDSVPPANNPPRDGTYLNVQGISFGEKGALEPVKHPDDKSAEFLGTQGYVEVSFDPLRNPPASFTVELWLRPRGTGTGTQVVFGSYEQDLTGKVTRGFVLDILRDTTPYRVRARVGDGTGNTAIETSLGDGLIHDGWRQVVLTYSKPMQSLMLYVNADDGKPDAQQPSATNAAPVAYMAVADPSTPLRIAAGRPSLPMAGGVGGPAGGDVAMFLDGRLDEVALYREALDGNTIRDHYLAATSGPA